MCLRASNLVAIAALMLLSSAYLTELFYIASGYLPLP
jgi:hypothetical protein